MNLKTGKQSRQQLRKIIKKEIKIKYLLYLPEGYSEDGEKWPLMLFLHGAGERGSDLKLLRIHGLPKLINQGKSFPFIVVSPQCPENGWWPQEIESLEILLDDIINRYRIDEKRIYVTGLSMGGYGTWALAINNPEKFAAIAPICGGGDARRVGRIKKLPIWAFHGAKDEIVPLEESRKMVDALKRVGGKIKFTVYPEAEHDSWTQTYENPKLYKWFLSHSKK
ncbi:MAG: prolyl oligopeptidase family serine peptidase [Calditrichaceae bacterium]|nr:prolyl oligopeptidase family serine peptidase [Calditrichaceae bacterium]RQV96704.1 MAG: phospholipase [Calditrichota bacterium]